MKVANSKTIRSQEFITRYEQGVIDEFDRSSEWRDEADRSIRDQSYNMRESTANLLLFQSPNKSNSPVKKKPEPEPIIKKENKNENVLYCPKDHELKKNTWLGNDSDKVVHCNKCKN